MHVLFLSDHFPPENNAPAVRLLAHARAWARAGHRVTVVTGAPNFPEGRLHDGWRNRWYSRERSQGIEVVRVKTYIAPNAGLLRRALDQLSFLAAGLLAGLAQRRPDVVVASSPPLFAALAAWGVAALRRRPFVFELRDLWPASIRAVGALRNAWLLAALERLELFLYRRAASIVALTEAFRRDLVRRGIDATKIRVVGPGVDRATFFPRGREADSARQLGLADGLVVGYLGTHGMAHALENVLAAAQILAAEGGAGREQPRFLLAGSGSRRASLVEQARARGLDRVVFHPRVPHEHMPRLWSLCDVALIHLRADPLFETVIPSKLIEALAMGLPILLAAPDGEAAALLRRTGSGLWVPPEQPAELARAVRELAADPQGRRTLGEAALACARGFDRERLARAFLDELERVERAARRGPRHARQGAGAPRAEA